VARPRKDGLPPVSCPDIQTLVMLRDVEGMTIQDISKLYHAPVDSVYRWFKDSGESYLKPVNHGRRKQLILDLGGS